MKSVEDEKVSGRGSSRGNESQPRVDTQGSLSQRKESQASARNQHSPEGKFDRIDQEYELQKRSEKIDELHN